MSNDPIKEARRILEGAGYGPDANPFFHDDYDHDCAAKAVWWLRRHDAEWERAAEKSRKQAEREAEDAKGIAREGDIEPDFDKVWRTARGAYVTGNPHHPGWWICFSGLTALDCPWGHRWEWGGTTPWTEVTDPRIIHTIKAACYMPSPEEDLIDAKVIEPRTVPGAVYLHAGHRNAEWRDKAGCIWSYTDGSWGWRARPGAPWHRTAPETFPWTEVL